MLPLIIYYENTCLIRHIQNEFDMIYTVISFHNHFVLYEYILIVSVSAKMF